MRHTVSPKEEFAKICNNLQGMKETLIVRHQREALKVGKFTNRINNLNDVRLSTLKTIELAIETAMDLIEYHLELNKFDNLGYKVRHVLLTQPHFALDNLFAHSVDIKEANNLVEQENVSTQVETDTKTVQSKKQLGFQQKFKQIKNRISELKTIDETIDEYTNARNSLHGNYVHEDKNTKKDQYIVLNFETMKKYLNAVIKCAEIIFDHFSNVGCIPERATEVFCHYELKQLNLIGDRERYKFDEQNLKKFKKKSIIAIASYPSIKEIEKNGIEKIPGHVHVVAVRLKYNDLPGWIKELKITKSATELQLEHLNYYLRQYEKICFDTEFSSVSKEDNLEATIHAIRKAMADCNNLLHGREGEFDRLVAQLENDQELLQETENKSLFTILEEEIIFIEGDISIFDASSVHSIEDGKNKSLALSIAVAVARWKRIFAMKSDEELCKGHYVHEPYLIEDDF